MSPHCPNAHSANGHSNFGILVAYFQELGIILKSLSPIPSSDEQNIPQTAVTTLVALMSHLC